MSCSMWQRQMVTSVVDLWKSKSRDHSWSWTIPAETDGLQVYDSYFLPSSFPRIGTNANCDVKSGQDLCRFIQRKAEERAPTRGYISPIVGRFKDAFIAEDIPKSWQWVMPDHKHLPWNAWWSSEDTLRCGYVLIILFVTVDGSNWSRVLVILNPYYVLLARLSIMNHLLLSLLSWS